MPDALVMKSGLMTGVTEGRISAINGNRVTISPKRGFPDKYNLSGAGDSGSLWIEQTTRRAVALHIQGNRPGGPEEAMGVPIHLVLNTLWLVLPT